MNMSAEFNITDNINVITNIFDNGTVPSDEYDIFGNGNVTFDFENITIANSTHHFPKGMLGFTASCAFIIAIVGTFGNLLTILALTMSRKLRNCATAYVVNLAVVELLFCVFILPISGAQYAYLQHYDESLLSDRDCVFFALMRYTLTQVELQTIVGISLTRAVAVGCTRFYHQINSKSFTTVYISAIWLYSFFLKLPTGLGIFGTYIFNPNTMECDLANDPISIKSRKLAMLVEVFIPVSLVFLLYLFIFIMVRKSSRRVSKASMKSRKTVKCSTSSDEATENETNSRKGSESSFKSLKRLMSDNQLRSRFARRSSSISSCMATNRRDIRLARTIFTIFLMIIVCSVPVAYVHAIDSKGKQPIRFLGVHILYWLQYCLNLGVYVLMNRQYRDAYIECLVKIFPAWERHKGFVFPWETQSVSSRPIQGPNSSFKSRKDSSSEDTYPDVQAVTSKQPELSVIPEVSASVCAQEDEVFNNGEGAPLTRMNIPQGKKIEYNEESGEQKKEHWLTQKGQHTLEPEGEVVV